MKGIRGRSEPVQDIAVRADTPLVMAPRRLAILVALLGTLVPAGRAFAAPVPWATVNVCDPADRPGAVGVRVGVPAGPGAQWLRVRAQFWDGGSRDWQPVTSGGDGGWVEVGTGRTAVTSGVTFPFRPPSAGRILVIRGMVSVEWRRGTKVLRRASTRTHAGYAKQAGGLSLAQCWISR